MEEIQLTSWLVVYPSIYRFFTSQEMVSMTHHGSGRLPRLFTIASTVCPPPPYAAPCRWTVNHYKDAPGTKDMDGKWVIVPILINGIYCGYNRLTHLLRTSWDILVELAILVGVNQYILYTQEVQRPNSLPIGRIGNPESMDFPKGPLFVWSWTARGIQGWISWVIFQKKTSTCKEPNKMP